MPMNGIPNAKADASDNATQVLVLQNEAMVAVITPLCGELALEKRSDRFRCLGRDCQISIEGRPHGVTLNIR